MLPDTELRASSTALMFTNAYRKQAQYERSAWSQAFAPCHGQLQTQLNPQGMDALVNISVLLENIRKEELHNRFPDETVIK